MRRLLLATSFALLSAAALAQGSIPEPLRLEFDYVHQGVKPHEDGYLACVDFKDAAGTVYDVDVVVSPSGATMAVEVPDKTPSGTR